MENASKALLIAAAVLIVILLIAFGMRIFNSTSSTSEDATKVGETISSTTSSAAEMATNALTGNLFSTNGRKKGKLTGWQNTNTRTFSEKDYYIGLNRINHYIPNNVKSAFIKKNSIELITINGLGYGIGFPIKVKPNTKYNVSYIQETNTNGGIGFGFYNANGKYIMDNTGINKSVIGTYSTEITTHSEAYWMTIVVCSYQADVIHRFSNIQVVEVKN